MSNAMPAHEVERSEGLGDCCSVLSGRREVWRGRLAKAIWVLLALYAVLLVSYETRNVGHVVALLACAAALALVLVDLPPRRLRRRHCVFIGALIAFLLVNVAAVVFAEQLPGAGRTGRRYIHLYGVALCLAAGLGVRDRGTARRLLAVLLVAFGVWYVWETVSIPWRQPYTDGRLTGSRKLHTIFAMELAIMLPLYLGAAVTARRKAVGLVALACGALVLVLLVMTQTRFALLTTALITIPALVVLQRRWGTFWQRLGVALAWILLAGPAGGAVWMSVAKRERRSLTSVQSRVEAWRASLQIMSEAPWQEKLIGHGRFRRVYPAAISHYSIQVRRKLPHAHSVPFQTLVESGVLGVLLLVTIWGVAFWSSAGTWLRREEAAEIAGVLTAIMLVIAVMFQMDYCLNMTMGRLAWLLTGLAFSSVSWASTGQLDKALSDEL